MPRVRGSLLPKWSIGALIVTLMLAVAPVPQANAYLTDTASHPPPTSGGQAYYNTYGTWGPERAGFPGKGQSFVDPVFGTTITRLTNELGQHSLSDIYAKNGFTNADNTLTMHSVSGARTFIDTRTGAVVRSGVPGNDNSSFDPVNPDIWWWYTYGGTTVGDPVRHRDRQRRRYRIGGPHRDGRQRDDTDAVQPGRGIQQPGRRLPGVEQHARGLHGERRLQHWLQVYRPGWNSRHLHRQRNELQLEYKDGGERSGHPHLTVSDGAGATASARRDVTVSNTTGRKGR